MRWRPQVARWFVKVKARMGLSGAAAGRCPSCILSSNLLDYGL